MIDIPLLAPPPGVQPNFTDPPSQAPALIINCSVFLVLLVIAVSIRMWARLSRACGKFGWDDAACLVATFAATTQIGLLLNSVRYGFGRHMWDMSIFGPMLPNIRKISINTVGPVLSAYFTKISLLLLYYRLFSINRKARYLIYGGIAFCTIATCPTLVIAIYRFVKCVDYQALTIPMCTASNVAATATAAAVANLISDFYILYIPLSQVSTLKLEKRQRWGLAIPFSAGLIACMVSVAYLGVIRYTAQSKDQLYNAATMSQLSVAELNVAIIASCMIFVPAFYKSTRNVVRNRCGIIVNKYKVICAGRRGQAPSPTLSTTKMYDIYERYDISKAETADLRGPTPISDSVYLKETVVSQVEMRPFMAPKLVDVRHQSWSKGVELGLDDYHYHTR